MPASKTRGSKRKASIPPAAASAELSPMLVQYLVGLCCLRWNRPGAVNVTLGDMVSDHAAGGKKRDVDVTVTVAEAPGVVRAFKAYEVKRELGPLDVGAVEQLCLKLMDMKDITHRSIVSASGFTQPAQAKAASHGVELFSLHPWSLPPEQQLPGIASHGLPLDRIKASQRLLVWATSTLSVFTPQIAGNFAIQDSDLVFDKEGSPHGRFESFATFKHEALMRSTEILFSLEPAMTIGKSFPIIPISSADSVAQGPAWPHTHTMDISADDVHVRVEGKLARLDRMTISGSLQWRENLEAFRYKVIERVPDGEVFAGAVVAPGAREGSMVGLILSPHSSEVNVHFVQLEDTQLNAIRQLKLLTETAD